MVNYNCIRCGYTTNDKTKIKSHFNRKTICKPKKYNIKLDVYKERILNGEEIILEKEIIYNTKITQNNTISDFDNTKIPQNNTNITQNNSCKYCNKSFTRKDSLNRHLKSCKEKKKDEEEKKNLMNLIEMLNEQLKQKDEELNEQLKEQKKQIKKKLNKRDEQIDKLIKKTGINIGTQNIQNNIKILAYKNTDLSHLTDQDYMYCLNRSNMCIPHLLKRIHFNPKKPENHNVYISNIKNKYIMIYDGNKWNLQNQDETIDDIMDTNEFVLEQKLEEWIENGKDYPDIMRKFNRYLEKKEKDNVINKIKDEIKLILFNNRKIINEKVL